MVNRKAKTGYISAEDDTRCGRNVSTTLMYIPTYGVYKYRNQYKGKKVIAGSKLTWPLVTQKCTSVHRPRPSQRLVIVGRKFGCQSFGSAARALLWGAVLPADFSEEG